MSLRGSKLDAVKQAEYVEAIKAKDAWDVSDWKLWLIIGRVVPERCKVNVPEFTVEGVYASGRMRLKLFISDSEIRAECSIENPDASIFEIADIVRSAAWCPVDHLAFLNRGAYDIVLDTCVDERTGKSIDIPIFEPLFDKLPEGMCFDPGAIGKNPTFPHRAGSVPPAATAFHDITSAIRYPRRTFEYCRMAFEVIRSYFDPEVGNYVGGELALCAALRMDRNNFRQLEAVAARSRHGDLVYAMNAKRRMQALELTWETVARFIAYLEGESSEGWATYSRDVDI